MDKHDKTWLWLVVASFLSVTMALLFAYLELKDLTDPVAA